MTAQTAHLVDAKPPRDHLLYRHIASGEEHISTMLFRGEVIGIFSVDISQDPPYYAWHHKTGTDWDLYQSVYSTNLGSVLDIAVSYLSHTRGITSIQTPELKDPEAN